MALTKRIFYLAGFLLVIICMCNCKKDNPNGSTQQTYPPLNDGSIALGDSINDAEYNKAKNLILAISDMPDYLYIIDPIGKTTLSISLNLSPNCVSISPDGNRAIIGHNGWLSYFDLNTNTLIKMQAVTCDAFDVVLKNNGYAYVFPENSQWDRIRCINMLTGIEIKSIGNFIYGNTKGKLHPSGNFIYGADNGLSPDDIERYNMSGDTANYVYSKTPTSNYTYGGDLWLAEDSGRIFTKSRNVFASTNTQSTDVSFVGTLAGNSKIMTLDYSKSANAIYVVLMDPNNWVYEADSVIQKYSGTNLTLQGTVTLPRLYVPNGQPSTIKKYSSVGYFGFFNSQGTYFHSIVKATDGARKHQKWAVVTLAVN